MTRESEPKNNIPDVTILLFKNPVTAGSDGIWQALDINQHNLEQHYADQVSQENLTEEQKRNNQHINRG